MKPAKAVELIRLGSIESFVDRNPLAFLAMITCEGCLNKSLCRGRE
jgi:hypothetical protein